MSHGITLLKQHENMPKFVILMSRSRSQEIGINWEIFTHNIVGHKLEKLTIFVTDFFIFVMLSFFLKKYAAQYSIC